MASQRFYYYYDYYDYCFICDFCLKQKGFGQKPPRRSHPTPPIGTKLIPLLCPLFWFSFFSVPRVLRFGLGFLGFVPLGRTRSSVTWKAKPCQGLSRLKGIESSSRICLQVGDLCKPMQRNKRKQSQNQNKHVPKGLVDLVTSKIKSQKQPWPAALGIRLLPFVFGAGPPRP